MAYWDRSQVTLGDIQSLCSAVRGNHALLHDFGRLSGVTIEPSFDFWSGRLMKVTLGSGSQSGNSFWCAGFGGTTGRRGHNPGENRVAMMSLLSTALIHKEYEEAVLTLLAEDAIPMVELMQQVGIASSSSKS